MNNQAYDDTATRNPRKAYTDYENSTYVLTQQDADAIEWHCKRLGFKQCRIVATTVNGEEFKENIDVSWIHMRTSLWEKT